MAIRVTQQSLEVLSASQGGKLRVTQQYVEVMGRAGASQTISDAELLLDAATCNVTRPVTALSTLALASTASFPPGSNPFAVVYQELRDAADGPPAILKMVCAIGSISYSGLVAGNPYTEVKRLLLQYCGRSFGVIEIECVLSSLEQQWSTKH